MTLTLREAISATQTTIDVNGDDTIREGSFRQLASEVVRVRAVKRPTLQPGQSVWQRLSVERGIENSEPVVHAAAVAMTAYTGGGGGGSLTVDNTDDPPAEITTLVAPRAVIVGSEASLPSKDFYAQDTDPGDVGAGSVWKDTDAAPAATWWERNAANDGWDAVMLVVVTGVADEDAYSQTKAEATGAGSAYSGPRAGTTGAGSADARPTAVADLGNALAGPHATAYAGTASVSPVAITDTGAAEASASATATDSGNANVVAVAQTVTGNAVAGSYAVRGATVSGMYAEVDGTGVAKLGFNAVALGGGVTIPVIPAVPTEQDIADVLVALGLATQTP